MALAAAAVSLALSGSVTAGIAPLYVVSSTSMMPTLGESDLVAGSLYDPDWHPERGDIILYREAGTIYASRVVGLPGEAVAMANGSVLIDGKSLVSQPLANPIEAGCPEFFAPKARCRFLRETTPEGHSYVTLDSQDDGFLDTVRPIEIPAGHVFVLGDNRDNSMDSRVSSHGTVPQEAIVGKVVSIMFSTRPGSWPERLDGFPKHH